MVGINPWVGAIPAALLGSYGGFRGAKEWLWPEHWEGQTDKEDIETIRRDLGRLRGLVGGNTEKDAVMEKRSFIAALAQVAALTEKQAGPSVGPWSNDISKSKIPSQTPGQFAQTPKGGMTVKDFQGGSGGNPPMQTASGQSGSFKAEIKRPDAAATARTGKSFVPGGSAYNQPQTTRNYGRTDAREIAMFHDPATGQAQGGMAFGKTPQGKTWSIRGGYSDFVEGQGGLSNFRRAGGRDQAWHPSQRFQQAPSYASMADYHKNQGRQPLPETPAEWGQQAAQAQPAAQTQPAKKAPAAPPEAQTGAGQAGADAASTEQAQIAERQKKWDRGEHYLSDPEARTEEDYELAALEEGETRDTAPETAAGEAGAAAAKSEGPADDTQDYVNKGLKDINELLGGEAGTEAHNEIDSVMKDWQDGKMDKATRNKKMREAIDAARNVEVMVEYTDPEQADTMSKAQVESKDAPKGQKRDTEASTILEEAGVSVPETGGGGGYLDALMAESAGAAGQPVPETGGGGGYLDSVMAESAGEGALTPNQQAAEDALAQEGVQAAGQTATVPEADRKQMEDAMGAVQTGAAATGATASGGPLERHPEEAGQPLTGAEATARNQRREEMGLHAIPTEALPADPAPDARDVSQLYSSVDLEGRTNDEVARDINQARARQGLGALPTSALAGQIDAIRESREWAKMSPQDMPGPFNDPDAGRPIPANHKRLLRDQLEASRNQQMAPMTPKPGASPEHPNFAPSAVGKHTNKQVAEEAAALPDLDIASLTDAEMAGAESPAPTPSPATTHGDGLASPLLGKMLSDNEAAAGKKKPARKPASKGEQATPPTEPSIEGVSVAEPESLSPANTTIAQMGIDSAKSEAKPKATTGDGLAAPLLGDMLAENEAATKPKPKPKAKPKSQAKAKEKKKKKDKKSA
jgi:hypothetical protein